MKILTVLLMNNAALRKLAYKSLLELATSQGFNASGKDEVFGCIFGRDSALTILKILKVHTHKPSLELLEISRKALLTLVKLQGREFNLESGEQPGKFIHEFRKSEKEKERLLSLKKPWYVYPDDTIKNYDSIDSTPLTLIAIYKYWQISQDSEFLLTVLPAVEAGLNWIITFGDMDKDDLIEYELPKERTHGGLPVQSWTDSHESLMDKFGKFPKYQIAPVEAQGYAWLALKLWGNFYLQHSPQFGQKLLAQSQKLKSVFNKKFIIKDSGHFYAAQALDGNKNKIKTITGNPLLLLWASFTSTKHTACIIDDEYIPDFVKRAFKEDLFDKDAGIRTMSTKSPTFNPSQNSYHNGSFWPILNGMVHEGLENWGFKLEANKLKEATIKPLLYFKTPIELYIKNELGNYQEFKSPSGQTSCKVQAWSAAAMLDLLTEESEFDNFFNPLYLFWQKILLKYNPWKTLPALTKNL